MTTFTVRHARTVILETDVEADDRDCALVEVIDMQREGKACVKNVVPTPDTRVVDVVDDETIWEVVDYPSGLETIGSISSILWHESSSNVYDGMRRLTPLEEDLAKEIFKMRGLEEE
jgi:hypothetical protein